MTIWLHILSVYTFIVISTCVSAPKSEVAKFSFSSLLEATLPVIHPLVNAGSKQCEYVKSIFGLTYTQMQEKNATNISDLLTIDLITRNGNKKYNLTATKRLQRMMSVKKTIILIHGFMESSEGLMVQAVSTELLKKYEYRILAFDGRKIIGLEYFRSSTYARLMGENLGRFLSETINNGQDPSKLILIGHSLGAHIAGVAGKTVQDLTGRSIGRIIALDPAGPCFTFVDANERLHSGDAAYVDVIHTNGGILGLKEPVGHKDFFPNGGMTQPGCFLSTCDHSRAWVFLAESITAPEHFPARKCGNWTLFQSGICATNEISFMGISSEIGEPGSYFLATSSSNPYGLGPAGSG